VTAAKPPKRRESPAVPARWVDAAAFCQRFGMSRATMERRLKAGDVPQPVRLGGRRLWSVAELERFEARLLADRAQP
jgi:predicted DNA-binding transcriptional regulator AlpA